MQKADFLRTPNVQFPVIATEKNAIIPIER